MSIALFLKNNLKNFSPIVGLIMNRIPYDIRPGIGKIYNMRKLENRFCLSASNNLRQEIVLERLKSLVKFSYQNLKAYKDIYDSAGFDPKDLKSFSDIQKIPVVTKSILNQYPLEERSYLKKGRYIVNTGGSSGTPFSFYIEPSSMGHEWAHMHLIWEKFGYKPSDLKIVFGGRSDIKKLVEYDVVRNHFALDIYASYEQVSAKLRRILKRYKIKYLHGYPSSIYDFAKYCQQYDLELLSLLRKNLKGVFLGSEYPHKHYRETIEQTFDVPTISWYGHTERAVLAYERETPFEYEPFLSYGFAEVVPNEKGEYELVGTSYYNYASPLIRYNTEDIIESPVIEDGILKSFKILKGRTGEFVIDRDGKSVNLTALIFGRHHELFNVSKFLQVKQVENGIIEVYFVSDLINEEEASKLFDKRNLNFDIFFKKVNQPIRTISGKIGLLVK